MSYRIVFDDNALYEKEFDDLKEAMQYCFALQKEQPCHIDSDHGIITYQGDNAETMRFRDSKGFEMLVQIDSDFRLPVKYSNLVEALVAGDYEAFRRLSETQRWPMTARNFMKMYRSDQMKKFFNMDKLKATDLKSLMESAQTEEELDRYVELYLSQNRSSSFSGVLLKFTGLMLSTPLLMSYSYWKLREEYENQYDTTTIQAILYLTNVNLHQIWKHAYPEEYREFISNLMGLKPKKLIDTRQLFKNNVKKFTDPGLLNVMKEYLKHESVYSFLGQKVQLSSFIKGLIKFERYDAISYLTEQLKSQAVDVKIDCGAVIYNLRKYLPTESGQESVQELIVWLKTN